MPRLNRDGSLWCSGIAGAGFYGGDFDARGDARLLVEQQNAGMRGFLSDDEGVTQFGDSQILGVNVRTGHKRPVDERGASEVQACNGTWAAFFTSDTPGLPKGTVQVRTSTGLKIDRAYMGASTGPMRNDCVGPDGSVAIKDEYHSYGPWHVYRRDGSRWLLSTQDAVNIQLLGGDRAIFREGWMWVGIGVYAPEPLTEPAWNLRYLDTAEGPWIIYQENNGRVFAHPNGTPIGHVLGTATDAFGIDARVLPDGRVRVIWATSEGEAPFSIVTRYFRLTDARVPLEAATQPPPDPEPNPDPVPEPTPMPTLPASLLASVKAERAKYGPEPTGIELGLMLNAVAWQHKADGWGLSYKPHGTHVMDPGGRWIAHDILHHQPTDTLWDVFIAAGARAEPTWTQVAHHNDPARVWLAPVPPAGGEPAPKPVPDPDVAALLARIAELEAELAEWRGHPVAQDDYQLLLGTIHAAAQAHGRPLGDELTAHLCSRFILRRDTDEMIVEEARLRGRGEWHDQW